MKVKKESVKQSILISLPFMVWFLVFWPGLYYGDSFSDYYESINSIIDYQASPIYYIYLKVVIGISKKSWVFGLVNITMATFCLSKLLTLFNKFYGNKRKHIIAILLFFSIPLNGAIVFAYTRDFWACWLNILLSIEIFKAVADKKYFKLEIKNIYLTYILLLSAFNGLIRKENISISLLAIFILLIISSRKKKIISMALLIYGLSFLALPITLGMSPKNLILGEYKYQLVGIINPFSYMIRNNKNSIITDNEKAIISKIVPYEKFLSDNNNYRNGPSNYKKIINKSDNSFTDFRSIYFRLIFENPKVFIKGRLLMGLALLGYDNPVPKISDTFFQNKGKSASLVRRANKNFTKEKRLFSGVAQKIVNFIEEKKNIIYELIFESSFISLVMCTLSLIFFKRFPALAAASSLVMIRIPLVVVTAPVSQFRYVYSLYIFTLIFIYLFLIEVYIRKKLSD